jgi:hypothetical protein
MERQLKRKLKNDNIEYEKRYWKEGSDEKNETQGEGGGW